MIYEQAALIDAALKEADEASAEFAAARQAMDKAAARVGNSMAMLSGHLAVIRALKPLRED
jgi:hypothetical protein